MKYPGTEYNSFHQEEEDEDIWNNFAARMLQENRGSNRSSTNDGEQGRFILTVIYLCILGFCCITPLIYYIRLHFEEAENSRMRELENAGIAAALRRSNRDDTEATRRKYAEERRARLKQLFEPVKIVSKVYVIHFD